MRWHNFRRRRGDSHLTIQRNCENLKKSREFLRRLLKKNTERIIGKKEGFLWGLKL